MAFSSIFDKNVFNQDSYPKMIDDENGAYKIIISPTKRRESGTTEYSIKGVLTEEVSFNFKADYDTFGFGGLLSNSKWLETAYSMTMMPLRYAGRNLDNVGIVTEKFYVKSGYLNINPTFKVVDWFGDGMPLKTAKALVGYCVPEKEQKLADLKNNLIKVEKELLAYAKSKGIPGTQLVEWGLNFAGDVAGGAMDIAAKSIDSVGNSVMPNTNLGSTSQKILSDAVNNGFWLTSSPTPVEVVIGNWFVHDKMVVEDVSMKFSKEMTKLGPLWAEFSLQMSSKEALSIGKDGFEFKTKRVNTITNRQINSTGIK